MRGQMRSRQQQCSLFVVDVLAEKERKQQIIVGFAKGVH